LWIKKSESDNIYWDCSGNIFNFLKRSPQQSLFLIPIMILTVFFSINILTIIGVSPEHYSIRHNREVGIIYHFQWFLGQKSITVLIKKHTKLNFGIIATIWAFRVSVLSSGIPRNIVWQILAIFLFSWVIYKSIKEPFLVKKTRGVVGHPVGTKFLSLYIMY
jgi:hypothetical protein